MFGIEYLRGQSVVEVRTSEATNQTDAITSARNQASQVAREHPGNEPDRIRVRDASGNEIGIFSI